MNGTEAFKIEVWAGAQVTRAQIATATLNVTLQLARPMIVATAGNVTTDLAGTQYIAQIEIGEHSKPHFAAMRGHIH